MTQKIAKISHVINAILNVLIAIVMIGLLITVSGLVNVISTPLESFDDAKSYYEAVNFFINAPGIELMNMDITEVSPQQSKSLLIVTTVTSLLFIALISAYLLAMKNVVISIKSDSPFNDRLARYLKYFIIFLIAMMLYDSYFTTVFANFVIAPFFSNLLHGDGAPLDYLKSNLSFNIDLFLVIEILGLLLVYYCCNHAIALQKQSDETL